MRIPRIIAGQDLECANSKQLADLAPGDSFTIRGDEFHHLFNVVKLLPKEKFEVICQDSKISILAEALNIENSKATARAISLSKLSVLPHIVLICGLPKSSTAEFIAEKLTEIGISELAFFCAERTQGRLDSEQKNKKLLRMARIRDAALKQSGGQSEVTQISIWDNLESCLQHLTAKGIPDSKSGRYICHLPLQNSTPLPSLLRAITDNAHGHISKDLQLNRLQNNPTSAENYIVIGPEGGLTEGEAKIASNYGFSSISLGPKVLRTETAAIAACALVVMLSGE